MNDEQSRTQIESLIRSRRRLHLHICALYCVVAVTLFLGAAANRGNTDGLLAEVKELRSFVDQLVPHLTLTKENISFKSPIYFERSLTVQDGQEYSSSVTLSPQHGIVIDGKKDEHELRINLGVFAGGWGPGLKMSDTKKDWGERQIVLSIDAPDSYVRLVLDGDKSIEAEPNKGQENRLHLRTLEGASDILFEGNNARPGIRRSAKTNWEIK